MIDPEQVQAFVDGRPVGLTPREFEVLYALARAEGRPIARERVYREVWGYEMMRGDRSVDVFVRKVRQKLAAARPETSYVQTHYGVGYRFEAGRADRGDEGRAPPDRPLRAVLEGPRRRRYPFRASTPGGMPERSKGAVCKTAGYAYGGSNPPPPTHARPDAHTRAGV